MDVQSDKVEIHLSADYVDYADYADLRNLNINWTLKICSI